MNKLPKTEVNEMILRDEGWSEERELLEEGLETVALSEVRHFHWQMPLLFFLGLLLKKGN